MLLGRCILILLLFRGAVVVAAQFCASSRRGDVGAITRDDSLCTAERFKNVSPPITIGESAQYEANDCNSIFLLDISRAYTSDLDFAIVQDFIYEVAKNCLEHGIGHNVVAYPLFDNTQRMTCCSVEVCEQETRFTEFEEIVGYYGIDDNRPVYYEDTVDANFTDVLLEELESFTPCLYNHIVLITNRIFTFEDFDDFAEIVQNVSISKCITLSIVIVGRGSDVTQAMVDEYYEALGGHTYLIPDYNCLFNIVRCVRPCGTMPDRLCANQQLDGCPDPTEGTTTQQPTDPPPTEPDNSLNEYWHVIYVLALSTKTTAEELEKLIDYICSPITECVNRSVVVRFVAPRGFDTQWILDLPNVRQYLSGLAYEEITINSATPEVYDNETLDMILKVLTFPVTEDKSIEGPRINLVTDFASQTFIDAYKNNSHEILFRMELFDFEVIATNEETSEIYHASQVSKSQHVHEDLDYDGKPIPLCPKRVDATMSPVIIIVIIVSSCAVILLILIAGTIFFRQRYVFMERLAQFGKVTENERRLEEVIDFWELSWDNLVVKNEKLGHGAHGQVFRGKLRGTSPGVEHYFRPEDRVNYANCEVAVKMLPQIASQEALAKAKEEFLREIDLMKSLGFNEHIVNMLGCITVHRRLGLVLEYCGLGDLLRFLKKKKAELEESRSIDDQDDCTKQFLHFGWQIAHGMEFLQQQGIIHRDLAARNILIDAYYTAKIGDFGLCVRAEEAESASPGEGRLPIKWLAIECLQKQQFSHKSDVWAFGIVLFEMHTMGEAPFMDVDPVDLLEHLQAGNRPLRPLLATEKMYEVMCRCWDKDANMRPSFSELLTIFTIFLEQATEGYGYLQLIKGSEHYRSLQHLHNGDGPPGKKRPSRDSSAVEKDQKIFGGWRKLAAGLKVKTLLSNDPKADEAKEKAKKEKKEAKEQKETKEHKTDGDKSKKKDTKDKEAEKDKEKEKEHHRENSTLDTHLGNDTADLSIDGHAVKMPISFPRGLNIKRRRRSSASSEEEDGQSLGRYSFRRRSFVKRHQSMPPRKSIDYSIDSVSPSRKDTFIARDFP